MPLNATLAASSQLSAHFCASLIVTLLYKMSLEGGGLFLHFFEKIIHFIEIVLTQRDCGFLAAALGGFLLAIEGKIEIYLEWRNG